MLVLMILSHYSDTGHSEYQVKLGKDGQGREGGKEERTAFPTALRCECLSIRI